MCSGLHHAGATLTVDLGAIRANYRLLRRRLGGTACAAVVKVDAYGLGAAVVAPMLAAEGCRQFFVAHLDEAHSIRPQVSEAEVFVLNGLGPVLRDAGPADRPALPHRRLRRLGRRAVRAALRPDEDGGDRRGRQRGGPRLPRRRLPP